MIKINEPVTIDPEFQSLIPPLSDEEYKQLEDNCKQDGILDSLKVWNGILVDGHNRYRISEAWDLNYEVCEIDRPDREAIKAYIANNQLGRRNLGDLARARLARIAKPEILKEAEERKKEGNAKGGSKSPMKSSDSSQKRTAPEKRQSETRYKLAKAAGMGEQKFSQCEAILDSGNDELIKQVEDGKKTVNQAWLDLKKQERKNTEKQEKSFLSNAEDRHTEFQQKKQDKVVSLTDIRQDKEDQAKIADSLFWEISKTFNSVAVLGAMITTGDKDIKPLKLIDEDKKQILKDAINGAREAIIRIQEVII